MRSKAFLLLLVGISLTGCRYYKVGLSTATSQEYIVERVKVNHDYLIIHENGKVWHLQIKNYQDNIIEGYKLDLNFMHMETLKGLDHSRIQRYRKSQSSPTNELHVYVSEVTDTGENTVSLDVNNISKIEVWDEAWGATIATYTIVPTAIAFGSTFIFLLIACNCPDVYTMDSSEYVYQGVIFPGAVSRTFVRDDYLRFDELVSHDGRYLLRLSNSKPETQYLDLAELTVVDHSPGSQVIYTDKGELISYSDPLYPETAVNSAGEDIRELISSSDERAEYFNQPGTNRHGLNEVIMTFERPEGASQAKLLINAKNSHWMDHTFNQFLHSFGDYYEEYKAREKLQGYEERMKWFREQGVLLNVYIDKGKGWEFYDNFLAAGSGGWREKAMILDLEGLKSNELKLKLESGFNFWELDEVYVDYTESQVRGTRIIPLEQAVGEGDSDVLDELLTADDKFAPTLKRGEHIHMEFASGNAAPGTVFLHSRGYYELDLEISGPTDLAWLRKFRKAGRFSHYSMENYLKLPAPPLYIQAQD